jgi:hypothetical protein
MVRACRMNRRDQKCIQNFSQKTRKWLLEDLCLRWENNIKMNLVEIGWKDVD